MLKQVWSARREALLFCGMGLIVTLSVAALLFATGVIGSQI